MRWARWALVALALTGCGDAAKLADENRRLRQELQKASTALDERWMESHADLAQWRREATIAAACDYLIPICPESMTAPGHTAMQQGAYGGGGMLFWGLVSAKFAAISAVLGAVLGALWLTLHIGFLRLIKPARKEIEEARAMIISAQIRDRLVREETREAQQQIEKIRQAIEQAEQAHQEALEAARRAQEQARQEQAALETIRQAREAIKGL